MKVHFGVAAAALIACSVLVGGGARAQNVAPVPNADARYQDQQQQYQQQLQQNQQARQDYRNQQQAYRERQARYSDQTAAYEALKARFADERAAYRRYPWPTRFAEWRLKSDSSLVNVRVHLLNGNAVGNVVGVARTPDGVIEALQVLLDDRSIVWLDAADVRLNELNGTVVTDLYPSDIRQMARERIG